MMVSGVRTRARDSHPLVLMPHVLEGPDGSAIDAEIGRLRVSQNRRKVSSSDVDLSFVRFAATTERPGPPMVYLLGGPGTSVSQALQSPPAYLGRLFWPFLLRLRSMGDVILVDHRGAGSSYPALNPVVRWGLPLNEPGCREQVLDVSRRRWQSTLDHWHEHGVDTYGYNTQEAADDLMELITALGSEQVILVGGSFGSHLALATLKRHGSRIRRAVLWGVTSLHQKIKLPNDVDNRMKYIGELAGGHDSVRNRKFDLMGLMRSVIDRLDESPITLSTTHPLSGDEVSLVASGFDLKRLTASAIGDRRFVSGLPRLAQQLSNGDYGWLARQLVSWRTGWFRSGMTCLFNCSSGVPSERLDLIREQAKCTLLEDLVDFPFPYMCSSSPCYDLGDSFRERFRSDVPVLFISGSADCRTPPARVHEIRSDFSNGHHIIVDGATHSLTDLLGARPETLSSVLAFLAGQPPLLTASSNPIEFEHLL